jgi:hypothetical protein
VDGLASTGKLTIEQVNSTTNEKLEGDKDRNGYTVLFCASSYCSIEVVEAILNKNINIDGLSCVRCIYYFVSNTHSCMNEYVN